MTTSFAPAIGPTYGGLVLSTFSWKAIFLFLIPILLLSTAVGLFSIPSREVSRSGSFNLLAFVLFGIGLSSLLLAIEQLSLVWLALGLLALLAFYHSNRSSSLLNLHVFKNRAFVTLMYGVLGFQMVSLGLSFILPNHLQIVLGQTSTQAGLFMFPDAILVAVLSPISGYILDKIGAFKPIITGIFVTLLELLAMTVLFISSSVTVLLVLDILIMLGVGVGASNTITTTLSKLSEEESADGNSILNTFQQFSGATATAIVSQIFALGQASSAINGAALGGQNAIWFLAAVVLIALLFILNFKRLKKI